MEHPIEEVQFHEVGALDSIVDVVLSCVGIEALQVERIYFSSLIDGTRHFPFFAWCLSVAWTRRP